MKIDKKTLAKHSGPLEGSLGDGGCTIIRVKAGTAINQKNALSRALCDDLIVFRATRHQQLIWVPTESLSRSSYYQPDGLSGFLFLQL